MPPLDTKAPWTGTNRAQLLEVIEELLDALKATTAKLEAMADEAPSQDDEVERIISAALEILERHGGGP